MKTFKLLLVFFVVSSSCLAKDYIVVSVAGFKTIRDKQETNNVLSNNIDKKGEPSGVWSHAPTKKDSSKILETAYLTHFSSNEELNSVLKLFEDQNGACNDQVDMILIANSWGAKKSQKLAEKYFKKCGVKPLVTYMVEGISKPTYFSFTSDLLSESCINLYQKKSTLHGDRINNCENLEFTYPDEQKSLFYSHIQTEWDGGKEIKKSILEFLNNHENDFKVFPKKTWSFELIAR